jgi:hypothetical protein
MRVSNQEGAKEEDPLAPYIPVYPLGHDVQRKTIGMEEHQGVLAPHYDP